MPFGMVGPFDEGNDIVLILAFFHDVADREFVVPGGTSLFVVGDVEAGLRERLRDIGPARLRADRPRGLPLRVCAGPPTRRRAVLAGARRGAKVGKVGTAVRGGDRLRPHDVLDIRPGARPGPFGPVQEPFPGVRHRWTPTGPTLLQKRYLYGRRTEVPGTHRKHARSGRDRAHPARAPIGSKAARRRRSVQPCDRVHRVKACGRRATNRDSGGSRSEFRIFVTCSTGESRPGFQRSGDWSGSCSRLGWFRQSPRSRKACSAAISLRPTRSIDSGATSAGPSRWSAERPANCRIRARSRSARRTRRATRKGQG